MTDMRNIIRRLYRYRASAFIYTFIGGLSALINWIVFYIFYTYFLWHYGLAAVAAFAVATGVNYILSERVGFLSGGRSRVKLFFGVMLVSIAGLGVDLLSLVLLFDVFNINIMIAKIIGTAAAFLVNFGGRQFFVFVRQPRWTSLSSLHQAIPRSAAYKRADELALRRHRGMVSWLGRMRRGERRWGRR